MKSRITLGLMLSALVAGAFFVLAESTPTKSILTTEPAVTLKEALSLAERYVAEKTINVSGHFVESVRLVCIPDNPKGERQWIITWALKTPSDGGQVFIHVKMDKSVSMTRGL